MDFSLIYRYTVASEISQRVACDLFRDNLSSHYILTAETTGCVTERLSWVHHARLHGLLHVLGLVSELVGNQFISPDHDQRSHYLVILSCGCVCFAHSLGK